MPLKILIAPSGFKESLDASEVAAAIAHGVKVAMPGAETLLAPLVDGGEGFTRALVAATGGRMPEMMNSAVPMAKAASDKA